MNDEFEYETLTQLGKRFGVSCKKMGVWLEELGLRKVGGDPTPRAHELGLVTTAPTGRGDGNHQFYIWHTSQVIKLLEAAGHLQIGKEIDQPKEEKAPTLIGPFSHRLSGTNSYEILNGDGEAAFWTIGEENADFAVKLLNLADKAGKLPPPR
jgi:hypothetical protein